MGDSSNSYETFTSSGRAAWNRAMFCLTELTTVSVEAEAALTTGR